MAHVALVIALLGRTDLFGSLTEADRGAVAAQMREATYEQGQLIFGRGDAGDFCTLSWKAASDFPCSRLKVECFRLATPAVETYLVRLLRSMAKREPQMPRHSRALPQWCWGAPHSSVSWRLDPS